MPSRKPALAGRHAHDQSGDFPVRVRHARHRPDPEGGGRRLRRARHGAYRLRLRHRAPGRALLPGGRRLPLVVRVPSQQRHHISRALDTGADGVMVPIVSSVEQAKAVLDAAKYWPDGTRGVALGLATSASPCAASRWCRASPNRTRGPASSCRSRIRAAPRRPTRSRRMPGVDMLWLGHNDLSVALGEPGAFDHPDFVQAEQATIAAARKHGKSVGPAVGRRQAGRGLRRHGLRFRRHRGRRVAAAAGLRGRYRDRQKRLVPAMLSHEWMTTGSERMPRMKLE